MSTEHFDLKPISRDAIPHAIHKAERYRLLNQSWAAESICRDILAIDPTNQQVMVMLVLTLTDQLAEGHGQLLHEIRAVLARVTDPYQRAYYTGIAGERNAQAMLHRGTMGSGSMAYTALRDAMQWYEKAEAIRPAGNDDAILRWNTCARIIMREAHLRPEAPAEYELVLGD